MDIVQFFTDFGIDYKTEGEHKHCSRGWVNIPCPHCTGNPGWHMGYHLNAHYFKCRRCGWRPTDFTISKLIHVTVSEAADIAKQYGDLYEHVRKLSAQEVIKQKFKTPSGIVELTQSHVNYLVKRRFDPEQLIRIWDIKATPGRSLLEYNGKLIDYSHRVFIPYYWDGDIVSYDNRDITGKHELKYIACPKELEIIDHKNIVYGRQEYWGSTGICVEGTTDAWRFGPKSFATSGTSYTDAQVRCIAKNFKRVPVVFDGSNEDSIEIQSRKNARKLVSELKMMGCDAFMIKIKGDPGAMEQREADYLVKQLLK